jgi:hypothetical protein
MAVAMCASMSGEPASIPIALHARTRTGRTVDERADTFVERVSRTAMRACSRRKSLRSFAQIDWCDAQSGCRSSAD